MGTVNGLTAAAMSAFVDNSITSGAVDDNGHLQLTTHGGDNVDAGLVVGPQGGNGPPGPPGSSGDAPSGAVMMFAAVIPPSGWLVCDGSAVSRSTYSGLFSAISTVYGPGDGATTFNLPDFRARMPRMDNPNIALAGGATPTAHDHQIDGGATDAAAHVTFVTPAVAEMERIGGVASWSSNFGLSASSLDVTTPSNNHINGAKVVGTTADNTVSGTPTDLLNPFLNISFIIKI